MALIKCPDCKREVSDTSDKCIHCGHIFIESQLIEKTSKDLKKQQIFCIFLFFVSTIMLFSENNTILVWGILMGIATVIWAIVIKIQTWWRHE